MRRLGCTGAVITMHLGRSFLVSKVVNVGMRFSGEAQGIKVRASVLGLS